MSTIQKPLFHVAKFNLTFIAVLPNEDQALGGEPATALRVVRLVNYTKISSTEEPL
jgi:hypothetical protein